MSVPEILEAVLKDNGLGRDDYELALVGSYADRGARLPVPRERPRLHLALDGARGHLLLLRARRATARSSSSATTRSSHERSLGTPVRYYPPRGGDVTAGESFRTFTLPAHRAPGERASSRTTTTPSPTLDVSGTAPVSQRRRSARSASTARASSRRTRASASRSSAPRSSCARAGRLPRRRHARSTCARATPSSSRSTRARAFNAKYLADRASSTAATRPSRTPSSASSSDLDARRRVPRRGHGHPGEDAVPRRARDAVAAHLRLRERRRRRPRRQRIRADRRPRAATRSSSSSTRATSRTARPRRGSA